MPKKILITGCSGYIGSHLTQLLKNVPDYEVHGLDRVNPQCEVVKFHKIDITQPFQLDEEYDTVIHLAALVRANESEKIPIQYYITNLNGTMNVVNKIKCKNFIFASSGLADKCVDPYGISKRAAEDVVREYCTSHNPKKFTIFRFYNVIGTSGFNPTNPDGLMYNLMKSVETGEFTIFGNEYDTFDGTCIRDYVHVEEICESISVAIENPSNQIECLGHGEGHSVEQMFAKFIEVNQIDPSRIQKKYGAERSGDIDVSVLCRTSPYMNPKYTIDDFLKLG